jgi:hypothetical protein
MCSFQPDKGYRVAPAAPYQQHINSSNCAAAGQQWHCSNASHIPNQKKKLERENNRSPH